MVFFSRVEANCTLKMIWGLFSVVSRAGPVAATAGLGLTGRILQGFSMLCQELLIPGGSNLSCWVL
jgi:hypothetical protein